MPWFMPSFGRPDAPGKLAKAPGGMPGDVVVLVNRDDPTVHEYERNWATDFGRHGWVILLVPPGSRFCEAVRSAFEYHANDEYFGIIDDDYWPVTPDWWFKMIAAAGPNGVAIANNKQNFPKPYTCRVMGGDLARAIGTIAPGKMRHNFSDDTWQRIATDFGVYHALEDVIVEHHHWSFSDGGVELDETYKRGSADFLEDKRLYLEWHNGQERVEQSQRVAELLGGSISVRDNSQIHLGICVPIQDAEVDYAFHRSFHNTTQYFLTNGIRSMTFESCGGSHIGKAREKVLWRAYHSEPKCTHFLFIDADMGWDPKAIGRLIGSGHDFAAAVGVKKMDAVHFAFNPLPGAPVVHPHTRFVGARHVGFAFVLLQRSVIDKMMAAYPELKYNTGDEPPEWALFMDMIQDGDGFERERLSEDLSFCHRWRQIGGEIWIDPETALIHAGRKEYTGLLADHIRKTDEAA